MKTQLYTLIFLILVGISSCKKPGPVACFAHQGQIEKGEAFTFKNCSEGATEYTWDLGDGRITSDVNPTHTYNELGNYRVTLTAQANGQQDEFSKIFEIFLVDLTGGTGGIYSGTYVETYPDSAVLSKSYAGTVTISELTHKEIKVALTRGTFKAEVNGDETTGYAFSSVTELKPARLEGMTSASGNLNRLTNTFTFTLSGIDPLFDSTPWRIDFVGTLQ